MHSGGVTVGGWRLLGAELRRRRRELATAAAWTAFATVPALVSGRLVALALDRGFLASRPGVGFAWLAVFGAAAVFGAIGSRRVAPWLGEVAEPLRDRLVSMVVAGTLRRAVAGRQTRDSAVVAQLTGQVETVRDASAGLVITVQRAGLTIVAAIVGLWSLDPVMALLAIAPVEAALIPVICMTPALLRRHRDLLLADEAVADVVSTSAASIRDVVACGAEKLAYRQAAARIDASARAMRSAVELTAVRAAVAVLGGHASLICVLLIAPWLLHRGDVAVGEVVGAITYITAYLQPALRSTVHTAGATGIRLSVALHRLSEAAEVPTDSGDRTPCRARRPRGVDLRVDGVTFAYGPHAEPIVRNLTLTFAEGTHLAVVGPSGIGKSTVAGLLAGLVQPQRGRIRLGGVNIDEIDETFLRRRVALLPQEAYVFAGTLRENLTYLRADATSADLDRAADAVGLLPIVDRLGGYEALLESAVTLSAGERQLIALARVWLSPAAVVLLDEATCHLDPLAEARAETAFALRSGTLIVVAHRISSALRADRILLMDGRASLLGTHEELQARSRVYAELVQAWDDGCA